MKGIKMVQQLLVLLQRIPSSVPSATAQTHLYVTPPPEDSVPSSGLSKHLPLKHISLYKRTDKISLSPWMVTAWTDFLFKKSYELYTFFLYIILAKNFGKSGHYVTSRKFKNSDNIFLKMYSFEQFMLNECLYVGSL